jgi:hypothetical protein
MSHTSADAESSGSVSVELQDMTPRYDNSSDPLTVAPSDAVDPAHASYSTTGTRRLSRTSSFFGTQAVFKERDVAEAEEDMHAVKENDSHASKEPLLARLGIRGGRYHFPFFTIIVNVVLVIMMIVETVVNGGIEDFSVNPWYVCMCVLLCV